MDEMNRDVAKKKSHWQLFSKVVGENKVCGIPEQSISEARWLINFDEDAGYTECFAFIGLRQLASAGTLCRMRKIVLTNRLSPQHSSGMVEKNTFAITRKNSLVDMQINRLNNAVRPRYQGGAAFAISPQFES